MSSKSWFNEPRKYQFLEAYPSNNDKRIPNIGFSIESRLGKDICDFNLDQLKELYLKMNPDTTRSAASNFTYINHYLKWCIDKNYIEINLIDKLSKKEKKEWKKLAVEQSNTEYLTEQVIIDMEKNTELNKQDVVIARLLFEGLDIDEIRELKVANVMSEECKLKLQTRTADVSIQCIRTIKEAVEQTKYKIYNTKKTGEKRKREEAQLVITPNVVRKIRSKGGSKIKDGGLSHRLRQMQEILGMKPLSPTQVLQSGMLKMAYNKLIQLNRRIEKKEFPSVVYLPICKMLGRYSKIHTSINMMREFITYENIEKLYGTIKGNGTVDPSLFKNSRWIKREKNSLGKTNTWETNDEWYKKKQLRGIRGEKIVYNELCKRNIKVFPAKHDYLGYDIKIITKEGTIYIEIKTIVTEGSEIYLTINEIKFETKNQDNMYMYILVWDGKLEEKKVKVYKIKNPIKYLCIPLDLCNKNNDMGICKIKIGRLDIKIKKNELKKLPYFIANIDNEVIERLKTVTV